MSEPTDLLRYASDYPHDSVLRDYVDPDSGLRMLVVRRHLSFCAYVGVRADHALAGLAELDFPCNCGITFCGGGSADSDLAADFFWWGWDYAHAGDYVDWEMSLPAEAPVELRLAAAELSRLLSSNRPVKNWTLGEVVEDALDVMMGLRQSLSASAQYAALVLAH